MTKRELIFKYEELLKEKGMYRIDNVTQYSNKAQLTAAIKCLETPDEVLDDYFTIVKYKYKNICNLINEVGDFKHHSHNRWFIYESALSILS